MPDDKIRQRFEKFMEYCWTKYEEMRSAKGDSWLESDIMWLYKKLQEERYEVDRDMHTPIASKMSGDEAGLFTGSGNVRRELLDEALMVFMLFEKFEDVGADYSDYLFDKAKQQAEAKEQGH